MSIGWLSWGVFVLIPSIFVLTVINELDGLAKGNRAQQYESREHAAMVKAEARSAVQFLEEAFESRNSRLRAVTSKGSTLDTIAFRSEEGHQEVSLGAFLWLCWGTQDKRANSIVL